MKRPSTGPATEFHGWLARGELRVQRCAACLALRHVPRALCLCCGCDRYDWQPCAGGGLLYSWTTTHRALHPDFTEVPFTTGIVALAEGPRVLARIDVAEHLLRIDLPVVLDLSMAHHGDLDVPRFSLDPSTTS